MDSRIYSFLVLDINQRIDCICQKHIKAPEDLTVVRTALEALTELKTIKTKDVQLNKRVKIFLKHVTAKPELLGIQEKDIEAFKALVKARLTSKIAELNEIINGDSKSDSKELYLQEMQGARIQTQKQCQLLQAAKPPTGEALVDSLYVYLINEGEQKDIYRDTLEMYFTDLSDSFLVFQNYLALQGEQSIFNLKIYELLWLENPAHFSLIKFCLDYWGHKPLSLEEVRHSLKWLNELISDPFMRDLTLMGQMPLLEMDELSLQNIEDMRALQSLFFTCKIDFQFFKKHSALMKFLIKHPAIVSASIAEKIDIKKLAFLNKQELKQYYFYHASLGLNVDLSNLTAEQLRNECTAFYSLSPVEQLEKLIDAAELSQEDKEWVIELAISYKGRGLITQLLREKILSLSELNAMNLADIEKILNEKIHALLIQNKIFVDQVLNFSPLEYQILLNEKVFKLLTENLLSLEKILQIPLETYTSIQEEKFLKICSTLKDMPKSLPWQNCFDPILGEICCHPNYRFLIENGGDILNGLDPEQFKNLLEWVPLIADKHFSLSQAIEIQFKNRLKSILKFKQFQDLLAYRIISLRELVNLDDHSLDKIKPGILKLIVAGVLSLEEAILLAQYEADNLNALSQARLLQKEKSPIDLARSLDSKFHLYFQHPVVSQLYKKGHVKCFLDQALLRLISHPAIALMVKKKILNFDQLPKTRGAIINFIAANQLESQQQAIMLDPRVVLLIQEGCYSLQEAARLAVDDFTDLLSADYVASLLKDKLMPVERQAGKKRPLQESFKQPDAKK